MTINNLTLKEKVKLFKILVDDLDIVLTAAYGSIGTISSDDIYISKEDLSFRNIKIGTVVINTNIYTG
jgi:hypothetical protein